MSVFDAEATRQVSSRVQVVGPLHLYPNVNAITGRVGYSRYSNTNHSGKPFPLVSGANQMMIMPTMKTQAITEAAFAMLP